ncbi:hypothetical protein Cycma_0616 [Cyclobacterium marinum DSM 745]|uniref:Uncharacterized protein n=1 Tax=Cyclobacterium marinum (strain ATCC 25205 / DSM 745 / LMG 13164 / NCIMB 1802) TaxID=880070 RepID=G0IZB8_CYCMS|nr:hypothetical protein Cycma_0616 [Cyclobacterium marinum DSM 745]
MGTNGDFIAAATKNQSIKEIGYGFSGVNLRLHRMFWIFESAV